MSRTIRVDVTAEDIREGRRRDCLGCPIARATRRASGFIWVYVHNPADWEWAVSLDNDRRELKLIADLPPEAGIAAKRFDQTGEMSPFSFDLTLEDA
jgi:hypothetical protein